MQVVVGRSRVVNEQGAMANDGADLRHVPASDTTTQYHSGA